VLGHALAFARRGLRIFPCRPRAKEPACAAGCNEATTDPGTIERWWREEPDYNIGIATGAASGVFVVDLDGVDAEAELRRLEAQHGALPASVESITARGRHIFLLYPDPPARVRNSAKKIAPDIDVRGDGGYVVAPPSIHPSGHAYCWSVDSARTFAAAPDWLLTLIAEPANGAAAVTSPSEWRELVKGVAEGARDCCAAKLAGYLLRRRIDPFVTLELLQGWNATRCAPPLPEKDIERIVDSIATRELRRRGIA
jgi:hypothetical protein